MASKSKPTAAQLASNEVAARVDETENAQSTATKASPSAVSKTERVSQKSVSAKKRSKKYIEASKKIKEFKKMSVPVSEAIRQIKVMKYAKFDESVELHVNVTEIGLKGEAVLPHSTGKSVKVRIADEALVGDLEKGLIDFDVLIATPSMMTKLTKFAKLLGPRGLMPNPKAGTISTDPEAAAKKFGGNNLRYKTEAKAPIMHFVVGKVSSNDADLMANVQAIVESMKRETIKSAYMCSSMSPAIQVVV